jgi:hypothetical protein
MDLSITSPALFDLQLAFDKAITELVMTMEDKRSTAGVLTLKLGISIDHQPKMKEDGEYIKDDAGNVVFFSIPQFEHKITSKIQIDGCGKYEGRAEGVFEMYYDQDRGVYVLQNASDQTALF